MLKLHKKVEYALISLKHIQDKGEHKLSTAKEIAEIYQIPFDATSRVLQILSSHAYLVSEQGPHGGYKKGNKELRELSLLELIEIIEGPQGLVRCTKDHDCPIMTTCNVISPMQQLNENLKFFLKQQKVSDLVMNKISVEVSDVIAN